MLELKTNCAQSKTIMKAEGQLGAKREGKRLERIYGFKVLGNGRTSWVCWREGSLENLVDRKQEVG